MPTPKENVGAIDGAIVVARAMVTTLLQAHPAGLAQACDRARYCQMLATKGRLPAVEAHRLVLAAWISALPESSPLAGPLQVTNDVADLIEPLPGAPPSIAADMLDLVRRYQQIQASVGSARILPARLRRKLEREWASTPERATLLRRLLHLLHEEAFLLEPNRQTTATILVVDPEECVVSVISAPLAQHGFDVRLAENAGEARATLQESPPDLILCRMELPIENGVDFCAEVCSNPATRHTPVILLAEKHNRNAVRTGLRAGAADVLARPLDIEGLILKIHRLLDQRPRAATPPPAAAETNAALTGSLTQVEFADLVQILTARARDTKVTFQRRGATRGILFIQDGGVVHAQADTKTGEEAVYEIMRWKDATFAATNEACPVAPAIQLSVMGLLMEGARRMDEGQPASAG